MSNRQLEKGQDKLSNYKQIEMNKHLKTMFCSQFDYSYIVFLCNFFKK